MLNLNITEPTIVKITIGKYRYPIRLEPTNKKNRLRVIFPYNKVVVEEVKVLSGARYHGYEDNGGKYWTIENDDHNRFQLSYMSGENPYEIYDRTLIEYESKSGRPLFDHQKDLTRFQITRRQCIGAVDMGLGKTLATIETLEYLRDIEKYITGYRDIIWVGPRSAIIAVKYEFYKWKTSIEPVYFTYEGFKGIVQTSSKYMTTPKVIIFDEAQRLKTPTAQRSQAAAFVADQIRRDHGDKGLILLLTGTPAPKSPADWFWLARVACPGFLREGSYKAFQTRLAVIKYVENNITGGAYPSLVTWKDSEDKCETCGKIKDSMEHDVQSMALIPDYHLFKPGKNEVKYLYERLKGLVLVRLKENCLDLPDIIYKTIQCQPDESTLRAAQIIGKTSKRTIEALTLWRELSDGFQYRDVVVGKQTCELCHGKKTVSQLISPNSEDDDNKEPDQRREETTCPNCSGTGEQDRHERQTIEVVSPKEKVLEELLDEYEDVGRVIIYAGFQGAIDKIVKLVIKNKWHYIRVDGRGWISDTMDYKNSASEDMVKIFQDLKDMYPKVAFIAHPASGGIGLTLTASPVEIYYSNSFSGEDRQQSLHRAHRPGMDLNRGLTVIDIFNLPTDKQVRDNLDRKMDLQNLSLGVFNEVLTNSKTDKNGQSIRYF